jgi:hypothetical protein
MTYLERKMNRKQIEECKEAFRTYLKNHGDDTEDLEKFREHFKKWKQARDEEP